MDKDLKKLGLGIIFARVATGIVAAVAIASPWCVASVPQSEIHNERDRESIVVAALGVTGAAVGATGAAYAMVMTLESERKRQTVIDYKI